MEKGKYGNGRAGETARQIIESGAPCVECGGQADVTLDFDLFADLTQLPTCFACLPTVRAKAVEAMQTRRQIDTINTFGINGLGRS